MYYGLCVCFALSHWVSFRLGLLITRGRDSKYPDLRVCVSGVQENEWWPGVQSGGMAAPQRHLRWEASGNQEKWLPLPCSWGSPALSSWPLCFPVVLASHP